MIERPELLICDLHIFAKYLDEGCALTVAEEARADEIYVALAAYLDEAVSPIWESMEALVP